MQNAECRMQNAECRMQNSECRMQNSECRIQNAELLLQLTVTDCCLVGCEVFVVVKDLNPLVAVFSPDAVVNAFERVPANIKL